MEKVIYTLDIGTQIKQNFLCTRELIVNHRSAQCYERKDCRLDRDKAPISKAVTGPVAFAMTFIGICSRFDEKLDDNELPWQMDTMMLN